VAEVRITLNGQARSYPAPLRLLGLLSALGLEPRAVAVERNRQIVPRGEFGSLELQDGDRLEIVRLVGGG
jgi:sulfur carrier protein